jgi:hypothetical protein
MAISKEQQVKEAAARESERRTETIETVPQTEAELTAEVDSTPAPKPAPVQAEPEPQKQPPVIRKDSKRDDITSRFRAARQEELESGEDSDATQIRKFARDGMPPELLEIEEPIAPAPAAETAAVEPEQPVVAETPPAKRKVVIRGKEMELTEEELIAAAQKSLAADDYLDEAKKKLNEINELHRTAKTQVERSAPEPAKHSGQAQNGTQAEGEVPPAEGAEHSSDPFEQLGEKIQFGDPKEVGQLIAKAIDTAADQKAKENLQSERIRNERVRTQKILKEFQDQHPDLAKDRYASAVLRENLIEMQKKDLESLGIDNTLIPNDAEGIANWHEFYRTGGYNVRDVPLLLKTARDDFLKWKGVASETPKPAADPQSTAPKVDLSTQRTERRAAIQPQPTRTVAPKPDAVTQPVPIRDRSDIVKEMMAKRGAPRGRVVA